MFLLFGAFIAGVVTVFAPCVLPLLPVIIGGSVSGDGQNKNRPLIIAASLAVSLMVFTLLLKATSLLIDIPPTAIPIVSGIIIILVGVLSLFPQLYENVIIRLGIQARAQRLMGTGLTNKSSLIGPILTGAALGPVFSSCSPVYAYILATVLPSSFSTAIVYIGAYVLGLSLMLLLIGYLGQKIIKRLKWASNPKGVFQRSIAILFIVVGLLVISGYDKRIQTYVSETTPFDFDGLSSKLIPASNLESQDGVLNVKPYKAPEFTGVKEWINSKPLTLEGLKGKVVLVDFWTYSCINCIRTQPYLRGWYDTYKDNGLEIVGMHAPEFAFEKVPANVEGAVKKAKLTYPIALDNDFSTWNAYENQYWPGTYLIDADGDVRRVHAGEGEYVETESAIRQLLQEAGKNVPEERFVKSTGADKQTPGQTPETYLGTRRASNFSGEQRLLQGERTYTPATDLGQNRWTIGGTWNVGSESIVAGENATLTFNIASKNVYIVAGPSAEGTVQLSLDGKPLSSTNAAGPDVKDSMIRVRDASLYRIVQRSSYVKSSMLTLTVSPGTPLTVFTFGE